MYNKIKLQEDYGFNYNENELLLFIILKHVLVFRYLIYIILYDLYYYYYSTDFI